MRGWLPILKRELAGYFVTPVAYVFIVIFLILTGVFTFEIGAFFQQGQADLRAFFNFHPWLYLCLIPAVSMRLWAEERKGGTLELLMTLPVSKAGAVAGKFLAAWLFCGVALVLTFPMWLTVNYLGSPDNGAIGAGYIGSFLMAGGFLAIGACVSAATRSQVIAFVVSVVVCFGFLLAGYGPVINVFSPWAPQSVLETIASFSFLTRFDSIGKGVIDLRDLVFFGSLIGGCLVLNASLLDAGKGE
ncbi:MAG: ABC transporter permease subunit [Planctomycetota bacterium]|nr:ABC transporter permease subunit [Planctomycetota bacterium]